MVHPNSQLTGFDMSDAKLHAPFVTDVLLECSALRELFLRDVKLDEPAIDALTQGFTDGKLQLTTLYWEGEPEFLTAHLYNAARQWVLAPPRSLVTLYLHGGHVRWHPDKLQAVEGLVRAVAQRGAEGRPCERVLLELYEDSAALQIRDVVKQLGVGGVVQL